MYYLNKLDPEYGIYSFILSLVVLDIFEKKCPAIFTQLGISTSTLLIT